MRTLLTISIATLLATFAFGATVAEECVVEQADPDSYRFVANTFYIEERNSAFNIPGTGHLYDGTWIYEETNGLTGLQRGDPDHQTEAIIGGGDQDVRDEHCGSGPDTLWY